MCNVIAAGMSKQATQTRFLANYKIYNKPFYEAHTYLRHIGFARWFQRIESLFGGN